MREIKLQFWNRKSKTMSVPYTLADLAYEGFPNQYKNEHDDVQDEECDVLQYTGLKDKNGKEIYEGDILKVSKDLYKWFPETRERDYTIVEVKYLICTFNPLEVIFGVAGSDSVEIIGNIYENPELLKD